MSTEHTLTPPTRCQTRSSRRRRAPLRAIALTFALAVAMPGAAGAANVFTLDSNPASGAFAAVVVDSAGTGYFAWEHNGGSAPNVTMFCKVAQGGTCATPVTLPAPPAGFGGATNVDAGFPVLGSGSTVYVVGPRSIAQDVVVWTSTDGGVTFGPAVKVAQNGAYMGNTNPTDVLAAPGGGFYMSAHNPGLSFISVPSSGTGPATSAGLTPAGGSTNISDSTLGFAGGGVTGTPVEAFSMLNGSQPQTINFTTQSGTGDPNSNLSWGAPSQVTQGIMPSLAGGQSGLFLASEDVDAAGHYTQVDVRKYTPATGFGAPVATLQTDTSNDNGGRIFETPGGRVLVAWVGATLADNGVPIRLYDSGTPGSTAFTTVGNVAEGAPNDAIYLIRLAAADNGQGFVSYHEIGSGLLRVADLTQIQSPTTIATQLSTAGQATAAKLTVGPGTPVTDTATVQGPGGATAIAAGAGVRFAVYSDAACTQQGRIFASAGLTGGTATSTPITLPIGTWYLQAHYGGNPANLASTDICGDEVVTVAPAAAGIAGIIFVGGQILINTGFNTPGTVLVTTQITNALQALIPPGPPSRTASASAAETTNRCHPGQVLRTVGKKRTCVSNSFGTTSQSITAPGAYKITIAPNAAARRALARGKTLHVNVTLTFKPTSGGKPVVTNTKVTIMGNKASTK